jgi:hypothetical protein
MAYLHLSLVGNESHGMWESFTDLNSRFNASITYLESGIFGTGAPPSTDIVFASADVASIARGSRTLQAAMNMPAASRIIAPVAPIPVSGQKAAFTLTLTVHNMGNSEVKDACSGHDITDPNYATPNLNTD